MTASSPWKEKMQYLLIALLKTFFKSVFKYNIWNVLKFNSFSNQVRILHFPSGRRDFFNLEENSNHPKVLRLRVSGFWPSSSWNTQLYNRLTSMAWQNNFTPSWFVSLDCDTCLYLCSSEINDCGAMFIQSAAVFVLVFVLVFSSVFVFVFVLIFASVVVSLWD